MPDYLSISNLLGLLQIDHNNDAIKLAFEAERLRRRHFYAEAIKAAEAAAQMAHRDYGLLGVTLLYLSNARVALHVPDEGQQAIRDCDRAIRSLGQTPFNQAIAHVIRSQIESQLETSDCQSGLVYLERAKKILQRSMNDELEHNHREQYQKFKNLHDSVSNQIAELSSRLAKVEPRTIAAQHGTLIQSARRIPSASEHSAPTPPQGTLPPINLPILTRVVWPVPELAAGFELVPHANRLAPDYFEVNHLSIDEQLYRIEPVAPVTVNTDKFRVHTKQPYLIVPLLDASHGQFAIVRRTNRPDQPRQYVIVDDRSKRGAWVDEAESDDSYTHIHIIGDGRKWIIQEDAELDPISLGEPHIIGIVEAILVRVSSNM